MNHAEFSKFARLVRLTRDNLKYQHLSAYAIVWATMLHFSIACIRKKYGDQSWILLMLSLRQMRVTFALT